MSNPTTTPTNPDSPFFGEPEAPPSVWQSQSTYVALLTYILPAATLLFHKDFSGDVQVVAEALAGLATIALLVKRLVENTTHKNAVTSFRADMMKLLSDQKRDEDARKWHAEQPALETTTTLSAPLPDVQGLLNAHLSKVTDIVKNTVNAAQFPDKTRGTLPAPIVVREKPAPPTVKAPVKKAAPVKAVGRGQTVDGRKADGSLDLRTKEGRALKAAEEAGKSAAKVTKAPAKKALAKKAAAPAVDNVTPIKKAVRPQARKQS